MKLRKIAFTVVFGAALGSAFANGGNNQKPQSQPRPQPPVHFSNPAPRTQLPVRNAFVPNAPYNRPAPAPVVRNYQQPIRTQQIQPVRIQQSFVPDNRTLRQTANPPKTYDSRTNPVQIDRTTVTRGTTTSQNTRNAGIWTNTIQTNRTTNTTRTTQVGSRNQVFQPRGTVYQNVRPAVGRTFNFTNNTTVLNQAYRYESTHSTARVQDFRGHRDGDWRYGYFQQPDFDATNFYFSLYLFSPFEAPCVVSPWYYYPGLPAYLPITAVVIQNDDCNWSIGASYNYHPTYQYNAYGNPALNYAVDEIRDIFLSQDQGAIQNVVQDGSQIGVYNDGSYMYSLNGSDFEQMLADNSANTQTTDFQVTSVRVQGDYVVVDATHSFTDAENGSDTVYQEYRLRQSGGQYFIADFMTNQAPFSEGTVF